MISEFLMKGIDNFFNARLDVGRDEQGIFKKSTIKKDLSTVIKSSRDISQSRLIKNDDTQSKSRLMTLLEDNKQTRLNSVIKRSDTQKSRMFTISKHSIRMDEGRN